MTSHSREILFDFFLILLCNKICKNGEKKHEEKKRRGGGGQTPSRAFRFIHSFKHLTFHHHLVIKAGGPSATLAQ